MDKSRCQAAVNLSQVGTIGGQKKKKCFYVATEHGSGLLHLEGRRHQRKGDLPRPLEGQDAGRRKKSETSDDRGGNQVRRRIGITATAVIDRTRNAIYVVACRRIPRELFFQRLARTGLSTAQSFSAVSEPKKNSCGGRIRVTGDKNSLQVETWFIRSETITRSGPGLFKSTGGRFTPTCVLPTAIPTVHLVGHGFSGADALAQNQRCQRVTNGARGAESGMSGSPRAADFQRGISFP